MALAASRGKKMACPPPGAARPRAWALAPAWGRGTPHPTTGSLSTEPWSPLPLRWEGAPGKDDQSLQSPRMPPKKETSCSCPFVMAKCTPPPGAPHHLFVPITDRPSRWGPACLGTGACSPSRQASQKPPGGRGGDPAVQRPDPGVSRHTQGTGTRASHRELSIGRRGQGTKSPLRAGTGQAGRGDAGTDGSGEQDKVRSQTGVFLPSQGADWLVCVPRKRHPLPSTYTPKSYHATSGRQAPVSVRRRTPQAGGAPQGRGSPTGQGEVTRKEARERHTSNRRSTRGIERSENGAWPTLQLESQAGGAKPKDRNRPCFCGKNEEMSPDSLWLTPQLKTFTWKRFLATHSHIYTRVCVPTSHKHTRVYICVSFVSFCYYMSCSGWLYIH